jgi:hypothetical protein
LFLQIEVCEKHRERRASRCQYIGSLDIPLTEVDITAYTVKWFPLLNIVSSKGPLWNRGVTDLGVQ